MKKFAFAILLFVVANRVSARQNEGASPARGQMNQMASTGIAPPRLDISCGLLPPGGVCLDLDNGKVELLHVQGNVYMISGAGANIAVQIGDRSVMVVNTGLAQASDKVIAAIRALTDKPIFFIVSTSADNDDTGGNANLAKAGVTLANAFGEAPGTIEGVEVSAGAAIFAQSNVLDRMSSSAGQKASLPTDTYDTDDWRLYNGESIYLFHAPNAHTDGDTIVLFRGSDVLSTGNLFYPLISYPIIDRKSGGSIDGLINGLNQIIELLVAKEDEEGGTYVIPGYGPISDRNDVVTYRDMVTVIRARISAMVKEGMTLEQVKAAKPTLDYDGIGNYGATKDLFVESVYQDLKGKKTR
jgi:glyoxylase-like metal-dependent hydrolase (beta-lactamase superfamily II)